MANWQRKLMLADVWDGPETGRMTTQRLAGILAERLERLEPFQLEALDEERDDLVSEFRALMDHSETTIEEFDELMARLYDWGDTALDSRWNGRKVCWIQTFDVVLAGEDLRTACEAHRRTFGEERCRNLRWLRSRGALMHT